MYKISNAQYIDGPPPSARGRGFQISFIAQGRHRKDAIRVGHCSPKCHRGQTESTTRPTAKTWDLSELRQFLNSRVQVRLHVQELKHDLARNLGGERRTAETLDTPSNPEDRSPDKQPSVDHATLRYSPFSTQSRLLLTPPIVVRNDGDRQRSQSKEGEGWVEPAMERRDEELNNPTGNSEGGQVEPESKL